MEIDLSGTKAGGIAARNTNYEKHGRNFYRLIGGIGGSAPHSKPRGFASEKVGEDGLTGRQRARFAGAIGGRISRRPKKEEAWKKS